MYITILPHETIMLSVDGLHVVLMEQDQRELLQWMLREKPGLVEQCQKIQ